MPFADVNGLRTHFIRLGERGPRITFLHGLIVDNLSSFYFTLANPLAMRAQVLLYDMRGHGLSERPTADYGLDTLIADARTLLLQQFDGQPTYLLGNSFGGVLGLALAARHPELVSGLILIDPLLPLPGWREDMVGTLSTQRELAMGKIDELFKSWHGRQSQRKSHKLAKTASALVDDTTLVNDIKASRDLSEGELASIRQPTLALYGDQSNVAERGMRLLRLMPRCEVQVLSGCTHLLLFQGTRQVQEAIGQWLDRQEARPARRNTLRPMVHAISPLPAIAG
jgi:pimeloyl-ACP methyl ester carboxylesterase